MIDKLKNFFRDLGNSRLIKLVKRVNKWFDENVIKRKLVVFSLLFSIWLSLLSGAFFSPQFQTYTTEQLKTKRVYANGTGEIKLVSQIYSPDTGVIVLQFETKDSTSSIDRGIDTKRLKWNLYAQDKSVETTMEVVPIVDNKISVIIRNVPKNFDAFAIDIQNKTVSTSSIDIDISSSSATSDSSFKSKQASNDEENNVVQFYVTPQNEQLKVKKIKGVSREEFTLSEIEKEIAFQEGQIEKLNNSIKQLKDSIEDDESRKAGLLTEAKYLSADDLEDNQKDIATIESNIEIKNRSIETAHSNIEKVQMKLETLNKKKAAVKDGTFEFSNPIEMIEMSKKK